MIEIEHTAEYPQPATALFAVLADIEGYPAWQADVAQCHLDGPLRQGATVTQVRTVLGRRTEVELRVVRIEPERALVLSTGPHARPAVTQRYAVSDAGDGCRVTFRLELEGVPRMAEPLVRVQLGKQVPQLFLRLGELLTA
ncbi:SRPBCC family protein [Micromonospora chersina]|uniref:SRPBCC family protein n=1 Tax=Micromonospora chersina TaxID=47854 RepID=UPI0036C33159